MTSRKILGSLEINPKFKYQNCIGLDSSVTRGQGFDVRFWSILSAIMSTQLLAKLPVN